MPRHSQTREGRLNAKQKDQAVKIAAGFDPKADSLEMRREMLDAFRSAGVPPGEGLKTVLRDAGFDMKVPPKGGEPQGESLDLRQRKSRKLGPPPGLPSFVHTFLEDRRAGSVSQAETNDFMAKVREMAPPPRGIFVNTLA